MRVHLEAFKSIVTGKKQSAQDEYRQIIARANDPQPGDVERIQELMPVLGITADHVLSDVSAFQKVTALEAIASELRERVSERQRLEGEQNELRKSHDAAMVKLKADHEREFHMLRVKVNTAVDRVIEADKAVVELPKTKSANPRLFANE